MKVLLFVGLIVICFALSVQSLDARGWNDNIEWHTYEEALEIGKNANKPIMIVLHKTWCGACKRLKPDFAENKEIQELSKSFIMVNAEDDEAPHADPQYQVDGGYIPRIYFATSSGLVLPNYSNPGRDQYKYFYPVSAQVVNTMKQVLTEFQ